MSRKNAIFLNIPCSFMGGVLKILYKLIFQAMQFYFNENR